MSYTPIEAPLFKACFQLQGDLDRSTLSPLNQQTKTVNFLQYLRSGENRAGFDIPDVNNLPDNVNLSTSAETGCYEVQIGYTPKHCEDPDSVEEFELGDCDTSAACEQGEKKGPRKKFLKFEINKGFRKKGSIAECDFECLCTGETPSQALLQNIQDDAYDIEVRKNNYALEQYVAQAGNYSNGDASNSCDTIKDLPMFNFTADGKSCIHHAGFAAIMRNARKSKYQGTYKYFGGEVAADWNNLKPLATADNGGQVNYNFDFTYDSCIDAITDPLICDDGSSYLLALAPGAFQIVEYVKNKGNRKKTFEDFRKATIDVGGVTYDFYLYYDKCNDCWTYTLESRFALCCIPNSIYCNPDNAHKLIFKQTCGAWDCPSFFKC